MKVRTEADLHDFLDRDLIWRKKELTQFKFLLASTLNNRHARDALLRGATAVLYAHWEGYVKAAAGSYLEYLAGQRLRCEQLASNFLALSIRSMVRASSRTDKIGHHIAVAEFFRRRLGEEGKIPVRDGIATRSNLSAEVLEEVLQTLGLSPEYFTTKQKLIDEALLGTRNKIAHGEYLLVTIERWDELHDEVIALLEAFRTEVSNAVAMKQFLAA